MDYNIDNYNTNELLEILELDEPNINQILTKTEKLIKRFTEEDDTNKVVFFLQMQERLLNYIKSISDDNDSDSSQNEDIDNEQFDEWNKYEALPQEDNIQRNKITNRMNKVDIYNNQHLPMKRQHLGVSNTYDLNVAQGVINPTLKNVTERFINIDSQYRQLSSALESNTNYTLDLSDSLTKVLSLRLYSIQIPYTWYSIDYAYGNTCFWVFNNNSTFKISIEPGNYTSVTFRDALNQSFLNAGFMSDTSPFIVIYNETNGKITLNLNGWKDPNGNDILTKQKSNDSSEEELDENYAYFIFLDITGTFNCYENTNTSSCGYGTKGQTLSGTLGWLMGFRQITSQVYTEGNVAESLLNLAGPKYFIIMLDDYNQNHVNNSLVTITELSNKLAIPNYYNTSQPYTCIPDERAKKDIQTILPSAPRTLTTAQIYTINEIKKNRQYTTTFRAKPPSTTNTFAIIPIKGAGNFGEVYTDFSGSLQDNKRVYFGPVTIDRFSVKLLDDRGNIVDLHGLDWSMSIISENLYQY